MLIFIFWLYPWLRGNSDIVKDTQLDRKGKGRRGLEEAMCVSPCSLPSIRDRQSTLPPALKMQKLTRNIFAYKSPFEMQHPRYFFFGGGGLVT